MNKTRAKGHLAWSCDTEPADDERSRTYAGIAAAMAATWANP